MRASSPGSRGRGPRRGPPLHGNGRRRGGGLRGAARQDWRGPRAPAPAAVRFVVNAMPVVPVPRTMRCARCCPTASTTAPRMRTARPLGLPRPRRGRIVWVGSTGPAPAHGLYSRASLAAWISLSTRLSTCAGSRMASELKKGTTDNHTDCRYTATTTVEVSPHRALTLIVHRTASPTL